MAGGEFAIAMVNMQFAIAMENVQTVLLPVARYPAIASFCLKRAESIATEQWSKD